MNAPVLTSNRIPVGDIDDFAECCGDQGWFFANGWIDLQVAVDNLQRLAEIWDLPGRYGQDLIQDLMAYEPSIALDEPSDYEASYIRRIIAQWESQDQIKPRDRAKPADRYRTPQTVIDAFWHVVRLDDPDLLATWLAQHPADAAHLHEIWGKKCATAA